METNVLDSPKAVYCLEMPPRCQIPQDNKSYITPLVLGTLLVGTENNSRRVFTSKKWQRNSHGLTT